MPASKKPRKPKAPKNKIPKQRAPKKSRKEEYAEKSKPANKNPLGISHDDVFNGIINGTIKTGDPPTNDPKKRYSSPCWEMGIRFLYYTGTNKEVTNWFYCDKCGWITNCVPGGGTNSLSKHPAKHVHEIYKLTKVELIETLVKTSKYVQASGSIPDFEKILPKSKDWSLEFLNIEAAQGAPPAGEASSAGEGSSTGQGTSAGTSSDITGNPKSQKLSEKAEKAARAAKLAKLQEQALKIVSASSATARKPSVADKIQKSSSSKAAGKRKLCSFEHLVQLISITDESSMRMQFIQFVCFCVCPPLICRQRCKNQTSACN